MADHATLAEYDRVFDNRRFPPGRALQAITPIKAKADERGHADLARLCGDGTAAAMRFIALRARRDAQSLARGGGLTRAIDNRVDGNFGQIYDIAVRERRDYADEPTGRLAARLLDAIFPKGLAAVTGIAYEEQVALNEYLVVVMRRDHAEAIQALGLERFIQRLEELLPRYRASLDSDDVIEAADLGRAYEDMQIGIMKVVGWVMVMIDDADERAELLSSYRDQEQRLAAIYVARRRGGSAVADVPLDGIDLDPDAQAALDARDEAQAAAQEAAQEAAEAPAPVDVPPVDRIDAPLPDAAGAADAASDAPADDPADEADGLPLRPLPRG